MCIQCACLLPKCPQKLAMCQLVIKVTLEASQVRENLNACHQSVPCNCSNQVASLLKQRSVLLLQWLQISFHGTCSYSDSANKPHPDPPIKTSFKFDLNALGDHQFYLAVCLLICVFVCINRMALTCVMSYLCLRIRYEKGSSCAHISITNCWCMWFVIVHIPVC